MKKEIVLAWTRDFTLAWAEWWSRDMNPRLMEVFGVGVPNQLSFFNGRLLETYRVVEESKGFIHGVVNASSNLLGKDKIERYVFLIGKIRGLINTASKQRKFADKKIFEKLKSSAAEAYPWYTVSYLLPQDQWARKLMKKYPKNARGILDRLIDARKKSEGAIEELVEYWRVVARSLLSERKLPEMYASFLLFSEIEKMLDNKSYIPDRKQLEARTKGYIFLEDRVYAGISKDTFFKKMGFHYVPADIKSRLKVIKGTVSSAGPSSIKGKVQIIMRNEEIQKFKSNNILVTVMTNPFFVPIMKKAAAIITDEGGITCHAAIVSRELKLPCITGTKIATKVFKDGDMVEVDANKGIVRKI